MSELFKSAMGWVSSAASSTFANNPGAGVNNGGSATTPGAPFQEDESVGEIISITKDGSSSSPVLFRVKIKKLLAEGGFSYVYKGAESESGEPIAIKKLVASDSAARAGIEQEISYHSQFTHKHIAPLLGWMKRKRRNGPLEYFLALEFCPVTLPKPPLPKLEFVLQIFSQTLSAIKYLHSFGITHRDIKIENILIGGDGLVRLVDFGSATMDKFYPTESWSMLDRNRCEEELARFTTPMYRAPEMLDLWSNHGIDERSDLWALGCLLFALTYGIHPFQDSNKLAIVNGNYSIPPGQYGKPSILNGVVHMIKGLLKVSPSERMSISELEEYLAAMVESLGLNLQAPLPFTAEVSPSEEEGPPLPPEAGGGGNGREYRRSSVISSIKGTASSFLKNIKESSQQYISSAGPPAAMPPPNRPPPPVVRPVERVEAKPVPARPPPPSPVMVKKIVDNSPKEEKVESPALLLDIDEPSKNASSVNFDDLTFNVDFGSAPNPNKGSQGALDDILSLYNSKPQPHQQSSQAPFVPKSSVPNVAPSSATISGSGGSNMGDLLGSFSMPPPPQGTTNTTASQKPSADPFDLLGSSTADLLSTKVLNSSSSFQNLKIANNLSTPATTSMGKKNCSSPNLSDLILDDLMEKGSSKRSANGASGSGGVKGSMNNFTSNPPSCKPNYYIGSQRVEQSSDAKSTGEEKKNTLDSVFSDILSEQGFTGSRDGPKTINDLRKQELLASGNADPVKMMINEWREGKRKNIRALLASLHTVTWDGCNWNETNMAQMVTPVQVKKAYRKACLAIHPDKQSGTEHEYLAKELFMELNEAWAAFEEGQQ